MRMKLSIDSIIAFVLFLIGFITYLFIIPSQIQVLGFLHQGLSPFVFPRVAVSGFLISSLVLFIRGIFYKKENEPIEITSKSLVVILWIIFYLLMITFIGYYFGTIIFLFLFMTYLDKGNYFKYIIVIAIFVFANYILFEKLLRIILPRGIFFE